VLDYRIQHSLILVVAPGVYRTGWLTVSMYSPLGAAFRAAGLDIMRQRDPEI
jgi:hypothetical protein